MSNPFAVSSPALSKPSSSGTTSSNPFATTSTTSNPFAPAPPDNPFRTNPSTGPKNPFAPSSLDFDAQSPQQHQPLLKKLPIYENPSLNLIPDMRETGLLNIGFGDNLALVAYQGGKISRRDFGAKAEDGSLVLRETVEHLFVDPTGTHGLIIVRDAAFYINLHGPTLKARGPLSSLSKTQVTSVAWVVTPGSNEILVFLASRHGDVYEAALSPRTGVSDVVQVFASKENACIKHIAAMNNLLCIVSVRGGWRISTSQERGTRQVALEGSWGEYADPVGLVADSEESEAWALTNLGLCRLTSDSTTLKFKQGLTPVALTQTKLFLIVLLNDSRNQLPGRLAIVSKITRLVVLDRDDVLVGGIVPNGLSRDESRGTILLYSERGTSRLEIINETAGAWKALLDRASQKGDKDYVRALALCTTDAQREVVLQSHAGDAFSKEKFALAAELWAKCKSISFEEISLRLAGAKGVEARTGLRIYLLAKLKRMSLGSKKSLCTILALWLVEVFLDENDAGDNVVAFWEFLHEFKSALEPVRDVVFHLILSHGRVDLLLFYANLTEDYDRVLKHHLHRGAPLEAVRALSDLTLQWRERGRDPPQNIQDLYYRHAAALMIQSPRQTVDLLIDAPFVDPAKLLPAIGQNKRPIGSEGATKKNEALRYLEHCVFVLGVRDEAVHNFYLTLLVKNQDVEVLNRYIQTQVNQSGGCCFEPAFALRTCKDISIFACVLLYEAMDMVEEAVTSALEGGLTQAAHRIASEQGSRNPDRGKRLWLQIVKDASDPNDPKAALDVIKSSAGALSVEDVLSVLPDFAKVDDVRDLVCAALEKYNQKIERLKTEMDESSDSALRLRRDAQEQKRRYDVVKKDKRCDLCRDRVAQRDFFIFPCTHCFHGDCLTNEVLRHLSKERRQRFELLKVSNDEADLALLDEFLTAACPFCSEAFVQSVAEPLVYASDEAESRQWEV